MYILSSTSIISLQKGLLIEKCKKIPDEWIEKTKEIQKNVETFLENNDFIAADTLTVADFSYVTLMNILKVTNVFSITVVNYNILQLLCKKNQIGKWHCKVILF